MPSPTELVLAIVQALVDRPAEASARWEQTPEGGQVALKVSAGDRGRVIGRKGRTIQSLRDLATAAFGENNRPVGVELED